MTNIFYETTKKTEGQKLASKKYPVIEIKGTCNKVSPSLSHTSQITNLRIDSYQSYYVIEGKTEHPKYTRNTT